MYTYIKGSAKDSNESERVEKYQGQPRVPINKPCWSFCSDTLVLPNDKGNRSHRSFSGVFIL